MYLIGGLIYCPYTVFIKVSRCQGPKGRADALGRRSDYMDEKQISNHSILKINKDGSLSPNTQEMNATFRILRDPDEQYQIMKGRLHIPEDKIDETIKEYHDGSLQGHSRVTKTLQLLRRDCRFHHMRQKVEAYIRRYFSCQKNKHGTYAPYEQIQYQDSSRGP